MLNMNNIDVSENGTGDRSTEEHLNYPKTSRGSKFDLQ
jgi:hypothetical protein